MHKYHYVYKVINKVNNKFYIGIHSTNDPNDGYLGSGSAIRSAVEKYGKDNFEKIILSTYDTRDEALFEEKRLVTEDLVYNENCYNLKTGGSSGFVYSEEWLNTVSERAKRNHLLNINSKESAIKRAAANRLRAKSGEYSTPERKLKISNSLKAKGHEISETVKSHWANEEHRKMRCEKMKGVKKKLKVCPHCGKEMRANLERHIKAKHFELMI